GDGGANPGPGARDLRGHDADPRPGADVDPGTGARVTDVDATELELAPAAGDETFDGDADEGAAAAAESDLGGVTPPDSEAGAASESSGGGADAPVLEAATMEGAEDPAAAMPGPAEAAPDAGEPEAPAERAAPTEPMSVGRMFADSIRRAGVRWAFTVPGESFLGLLEGLEAVGINVVATRHEGAASFMAEAHAQLTGRPAACLGTRAV